MGSYNSANFTKLILNSIPYNKAYMGSKILFEDNNPFTIEFLEDDTQLTFMRNPTSSTAKTEATVQGFYTDGSGKFTFAAQTVLQRVDVKTKFNRGDKIRPSVTYTDLTAQTASNFISYVKIFCDKAFKVYGNITTWNDYCMGLFSNSTYSVNLADASGLVIPDTLTYPRQFAYMFAYCSSLQNNYIPEFPATTLTNECYRSLFMNCDQITELTIPASDFTPTNCCLDMITTTATGTTGTLYLPYDNNYPDSNTSWLPSNWTIQPIGTPLQTNPITVTCQSSNIRVYFKCISQTATIKYNDNVSYQTLSQGDEITLGTLAYWGQTLEVKYAYTGIVSLMATGDFTVSGDIADVNNGNTPGMFKDSVYLKSASGLTLSPTTLEDSCYYQMFMGCTGLTSQGMPALTATTLADNCYDSMFKGCTGLTGMYYFRFNKNIQWAYECCYEMFQGCTGLTAAEISPTGYPANYWYNDDDNYQFSHMFEGCSQLHGLYFYGELDSNYSTGTVDRIVDNCAATGKIYIQEDTDYTNNVMRSIAPQGWTIEEDDSNF